MGNRRFAQIASDDEDDSPPPPPRRHEIETKRIRKKVRLPDFDDEDLEDEKDHSPSPQNKRKKLTNNKRKKEDEDEDYRSRHEEEEEDEEEEEEEDEPEELEAVPIGDVIRVTGKGRGRKNHYESYEYDGLQYQLEDPVLLVPENTKQKPYVAIIKDIAQTSSGNMTITGQWFYRPEEAEKKGGGNWESRDTRELFYSFHRDDVPAESVMHKCVVHFIPLHKQIPLRKQHPGFIVQRVYDTEQRILFKLTDKDYEDNKQHEIDLLVGKTLKRIVDLPDLEPEDNAAVNVDQLKNKRLLKKKNMPPLDVSREDEGPGKSQSLKPETPGSTTAIGSEYTAIFSEYKLFTGEIQRDRWLEKLLQSVQFMCSPPEIKPKDEEERGNVKNGDSNDDAAFDWPGAAVPVVADLEKVAHDTYSVDFQKYNQKMRQLAFNLKNNVALARRLLNRELEATQILNMSPIELKEGLTKEERASREPEEARSMQMTDAACKRCSERQVGVIEIIQAGHSDRYQLECSACGHTWWASRDEASQLTIEGPSSGKTVGTAPLATAKFDDTVKNLMSPRGAATDKGDGDAFKKSVVSSVPVLDTQRSFNKNRAEENSGAAK